MAVCHIASIKQNAVCCHTGIVFLNFCNWFHSKAITILLVGFLGEKCWQNLRVAAETAEVYVSFIWLGILIS